MNKKNFPMYLAEVDVSQCYGFCFNLPKQDIGRDDIVIHVEYWNISNDVVRYNVWGQFKETYFRAYLCSSSVPGSAEVGDIVPKIMFDLNSSKEFYEGVYSFIDHFGATQH